MQHAFHFIDLNKDEMSRLDRGDHFITVIRPDEGSIGPYNGSEIWARLNFGDKSKYRLQVISALKKDDQWFIVMRRSLID